jgi:hypothetical protein
MTHENFLAMLKGQKEDAKVMEEFEAVTSKGKSTTNNDKLSRGKSSEKSSGSSSTGASGSAGPVTWNALLDDYPLAGQSMALKVRSSSLLSSPRCLTLLLHFISKKTTTSFQSLNFECCHSLLISI